MTDKYQEALDDYPDVIKFLLGEGQLDGLSFGEFPDNGEKYKRRYWWRKALREAWVNRAALQAQQWQPIETAPKDKWLILGYYNIAGKWRTVRGNWFDDGDLFDDNEEPIHGDEGWYETAENANDLPNVWPINPTHWMPLPAAPKEGE